MHGIGAGSSKAYYVITKHSRGHFDTRAGKAALFIFSVLLIAGIAGAIVSNINESQGTFPLKDELWLRDVVNSAGSAPGSGAVTLDPGFVYLIEIGGGAGGLGSGSQGQSSYINPGGNGSKIWAWLDLREAVAPVTYYYGTAPGGYAYGSPPTFGGNGGDAVYITDGTDILMVAAGGGGAGAPNKSNGVGGAAAAGTVFTTANGIIFGGTNGNDGGSNAKGGTAGTTTFGKGGTGGNPQALGGNGSAMAIAGGTVTGGNGGGGGQQMAYLGGAGGAGYTGGGGGGSGNAGGGGGGGGSSYIRTNTDLIYETVFRGANTESAFIKIGQYGPPYISGKVTRDDGGSEVPVPGTMIEYTIDGVPQTPVLTDGNGQYKIVVTKGDNVMITGVKRYGYIIDTSKPTPFGPYEMNTAYRDKDFVLTRDPNTTMLKGEVSNSDVGLLFNVEISYRMTQNDGVVFTTSTFTDTSGYYGISAYPGDRIEILGVTKYGYLLDTANTPIPSSSFLMDTNQTQDFLMLFDTSRTFTITGKVTHDLTSAPLYLVTIAYDITEYGSGTTTSGSVTTDFFGEYTITAFAGTEIVIKSIAKLNYYVIDEHIVLPDTRIMSQYWTGADFEMGYEGPNYTVSGTVKDMSGNAIGGAVIAYLIDSASLDYITTASDGTYTISAQIPHNASPQVIEIIAVMKAGYKLNEYASPPMPWPLPWSFTYAGSDFTGIDFVMEQSTEVFKVTGTVKRTDGTPAENVTISYTVNGSPGTPVMTNASGGYVIGGIGHSFIVVIDSVTFPGYIVLEEVPTKPLIVVKDETMDFTITRYVEYTVHVTGLKISSFTPTTVWAGTKNLTVDIQASPGYRVSGITSVYMGDTTTVYEYYPENIVIVTGPVIGHIVINATTSPLKYSVTAVGFNIRCDADDIYHDQDDVIIHLSPAVHGYRMETFTGVVMNGVDLIPGVDYEFDIVHWRVTLKAPVDGNIEIYAAAGPEEYKVEVTGTHIAAWDPYITYHDETDVEVKIDASDGYHITGIDRVTMDSIPLTIGTDYTVDVNFAVTIKGPVTGVIVINALTAPDEYDVDVTGLHIDSWGPDSVLHDDHGIDIKIYCTDGYHLVGIGSVEMKGVALTLGVGYTFDGDHTVFITGPVNGKIVIAAVTAPDEYKVEATGVHINSWSPVIVYHDDIDVEAEIFPENGYYIFAIDSVTMNGVVLALGTDYTVGINSKVKVNGPVDGDIVINADIHPNEYWVDVDGAKVIAWGPDTVYHADADIIVKIYCSNGYHVTGIDSVTMQGIVLVPGQDYTYDGDHAVILSVPVFGNILIKAQTAPDEYKVEVAGAHIATWSPGAVYHDDVNVSVSVSPIGGYNVAGIDSVVMKGSVLTLNVHYTVAIDNTVTIIGPVTGDIVIITVPDPWKYAVDVTGAQVATWGPKAVCHDDHDIEVWIYTNNGYHVSDIETVVMNGVTLIPGQDYTYDGNFTVVVFPLITGPIEIKAVTSPDEYTVEVAGDHIDSWSPAVVYHDELNVKVSFDVRNGYKIIGIGPVEMNGIGLTFGTDYSIDSDLAVTLNIPVDGDIAIVVQTQPLEYDVEVTGTHIFSWGPDHVQHDDSNIEVKIYCTNGYHVSGIGSVVMNGFPLVLNNDYTFDGDHAVTVKGPVDGKIVIAVLTEPDEYKVEAAGSHISSWSPVIAYHDDTNIDVSINTQNGYHITGIDWVTMHGVTLTLGTDYSVDSDFVVTVNGPVTGDIVIEVLTAPDEYAVAVDGDHIDNWGPDKVYHADQGIDVKIYCPHGYHVTGIESVTMNGIVLIPNNDYIYDGDHAVLIYGPVTGAILITAIASPDEYDVEVVGAHISSWDPEVAYHDDEDVEIIIYASSGYHVSGIELVNMDGIDLNFGTEYTYDGNRTVTIKGPVTGDIAINAVVDPDEYDVAAVGGHVITWGPGLVHHGDHDFDVLLFVARGYYVSGIGSVTMAGSSLTPGVDYIYDGDHTVFIKGPVDGNIVISVLEEPYYFFVSGTVTVAGSGVPIQSALVTYTVTAPGGAVTSGTASTDNTGYYEIMVVTDMTVSITAVSKSGYILVSPLKSVFVDMDDEPGVDFQMKSGGGSDGFTVSGTVTLDTDGSPISGAIVSFRVNGGSVQTTTTDANGKYAIRANAGASILITGVTKSGYERITPLPAASTASGVYNCVMSANSFSVTVTVTSEEGGSFVYMINNDGIWRPLMPDARGSYVIDGVQNGTPLRIRATPDNEGSDVVWGDESGARMAGDTYTLTLRSDRDLTVEFRSSSENNWWIYAAILLAVLAAGLFFFIIFWMRRCAIEYLVTFSNKGIEQVRIDYTVNEEPAESVFTDESGYYKIRVKKDSAVMITGVVLEGYTVSETLPMTVIAEKGVVEVKFTLRKAK